MLWKCHNKILWPILNIFLVLSVDCDNTRVRAFPTPIAIKQKLIISDALRNVSLSSFFDSTQEKKETQSQCFHKERRKALNSFLCGIFLQNFIIPTGNAMTTKEVPGSIENVELCMDGTIVAEIAVPGAYQQMCMQLPERTVTLKSTGEKLIVKQGTNSANGGTVSGRTGVAVWNSCLLLTRLLDQLGTNVLKDKVVLELGCGTGLASLAAGKLGAARVFATDGNEEVISLAKTNIENNQMSTIVEASKLQWGLLDASEYYDSADIVVGSDLTYNSGTWRLLAETVVSVLKPGGIFLYLSLGHQGFNVSGEMDGFLTVAQNMGLVELRSSSDTWQLKGGAASLNKILQGFITNDEKSIIDATGGVKIILLTRK